jgi:hypothetical protein
MAKYAIMAIVYSEVEKLALYRNDANCYHYTGDIP